MFVGSAMFLIARRAGSATCASGIRLHFEIARPLAFCSLVSYTNPQLSRFSEDDETADDYGRDSPDEGAFEDGPEGEAE